MIFGVGRGLAAAEEVLFVDAAAAGLHEDEANFVDFCHFSEAGAGRFALKLSDAIVARFGGPAEATSPATGP